MASTGLRRCLFVMAWFVMTWCFAFIGISDAIEVTLNLDPGQSSLSGVLYVGPVDVDATSQDSPTDSSVTTTFSGTITVDVDDIANPTSIKFVSANAIAANSGTWLPDALGGSEGTPANGDATPGIAEPANYGWFLDLGAVGTVYAASRDTVLDLRSFPRSVSSGDFDPLNIFITSPQGVFASNVSSGIFGDGANTGTVETEKGFNCTDITGDPNNCSGQVGNYSVAGNTATLSLPVQFVLGGAHGVADFNSDGQIDAADYTTWLDNLGGSDPAIDVDGSGTVDAGDYDIWLSEFGEEADEDDDFLVTFTGDFVATVVLPGSGSGSGVVPEPMSLMLLGAGLAGLLAVRRRR